MDVSFSSSDELTRQKALAEYRILDTLPEQDYDDLTQLASQICQTPISLITLVDDKRQWFKSAHGLSAQETPKEGGFCTRTVSHPIDLSIIEDARISDQFARHPLVVGDPYIVFYAGAPLVDEQGFALGSLCVLDDKPRQLDHQQRTALKVLAKQVVNLLTLRRQNQALSQSQQQYQLEKAALAQSEGRFRSLIEEAPVATALYVGPQFQVQVANQTMLRYWGKDASVIGQPLAEALPELAGQSFLGILADLFTTGHVHQEQAAPAQLVINGQLTTFYFDYTYKPLRNELGQVYAIMNMAIDVTQQVIVRQALEENRAALNNAVELAELGTWTLDVASGATELSPRQATMFGLSITTLSYEAAVAVVHPADRARVQTAFEAALQPGSDGRYQAEYRIINAVSGQQHVIRAKGKTSLDSQGKPLRIVGTTQDITLERGLQAALEQQVRQRTEELTASNEEYAAINEELEEANSLLMRSNDNLQTFAYVASHDLQEPLRKIQQFGNLLQLRQGESKLDAESAGYVERMQVAASRMSTLIKDLLNYSRISTQRSTDEPVALNEVIDRVLDTLDVAIAQIDAQVQVDALPIVSGDALQLSQLFQNLLSNALKFHRPDAFPRIHIRSELIAARDLPATINPTRRSPTYTRIQVADNGIGFEEKYLDRIFQVFQRLHGKSQYVGTGIGLAICQRVVANHGGAITASSQPGQGATFSIYLPIPG